MDITSAGKILGQKFERKENRGKFRADKFPASEAVGRQLEVESEGGRKVIRREEMRNKLGAKWYLMDNPDGRIRFALRVGRRGVHVHAKLSGCRCR